MTKNEQTKIINNLYRLKSYGYNYHTNIATNNSNIKNQDIPISELEHCNLCSASKLCDTKIVHSGNSDSNLIVVSILENKKQEEKELLKKMIEKVLFLNFESIYMLNIVKCAIDKKDIKEEYIHQCIPFIKEQLTSLNKDAKLVFLGESYQYLNPKVTKVTYNQLCEYEGHKSLVLPELDYILKNPSSKNDIFEGLKRLKIFLEK